MKTIGLLGGMSFESTIPYYRTINREVARVRGGLHSARIVLYSVDFEEIAALQRAERWEEASAVLGRAASLLQDAGAQCLVICTNTMHRVADAVAARISIPLIHIADATAAVVVRARIRRVGLLGTRFTMEHPFYRGRIESGHGLEVCVPEESERAFVHRVIYEELCQGRVTPESRAGCAAVIERLVARGCEGVILGCTELGMLLDVSSARVPLFDTAEIHARAAAHYALGTAEDG